MNEAPFNIVGLIAFFSAISLVPLVVVTITAFLKIAVVMFIIRNAIGVQQTPPNIVLYAITLVLMVYVTTPLIGDIYGRLTVRPIDWRSPDSIAAAAGEVKEPIKQHLMRYTLPQERQFFFSATSRVWPEAARTDLKEDDIVILLPAFVNSELTRAFEIGFLLYLPFLIIDLVVANILMAMGMIMVAPTLISVPLKLFLFVTVDGWSRLLHGLILSYG